jgi:hypothetical protein
MSSTKWMITALAAAIVGCYSPSPSWRSNRRG